MARRTGGRPGSESSAQRATKTGHEISGVVAPRVTRSLSDAWAGSGRGKLGVALSAVDSRNF